MTFTYTSDPSNVPLDALRLLIGDTNSSAQQLQDAELTYFLTLADNDVFLAAINAARTLAAKFARDVDSAVESIRIAAQDKYKHYIELAETIRKQKEDLTTTGFASPVMPGISISTMDSVDDDSDRFPNRFRFGLHDNPEVNERLLKRKP